jgi:hypothetical protein
MTPRLQRALDRLAAAPPAWLALAELVSLAVRVTPALLRTARLRLLPALPASAEAEVWRSPLVAAAGPVGITLHAEAADWLRRRLDPDRLAQAWAVTSEVHASFPPVVRAEEELTWIGLARPEDTGAMRAVLQQVLAGVASGRRPGLAAWARRALPRLPVPVRQTPEAWLLALSDGVGVALGVEPPDTLVDAPLGVLGLEGRAQTRVTLRRVDGGLTLGREAGPGIDVPDTGTVVLFVGGTALALGPGERRVVPWAAGLEIGALDGRRWVLREGDGVADGGLDLSWWLDQPEPDSEAWRAVVERVERAALAIGRGETPDLEGWSSAGTGPFGVLRIAGPDGSGRSTLLAGLVRRLRAGGHRVAVHVFEPEIPESFELPLVERSLVAQLGQAGGALSQALQAILAQPDPAVVVLVLDGVDEALRRTGGLLEAQLAREIPVGVCVVMADQEAELEPLGDDALGAEAWKERLRRHRPLTLLGFPLEARPAPTMDHALRRLQRFAQTVASPDEWSVEDLARIWTSAHPEATAALSRLLVAREPLPPSIVDDDAERLLPWVRVGPRGHWRLVEGLRRPLEQLRDSGWSAQGGPPAQGYFPGGEVILGISPVVMDAHRSLADRLEAATDPVSRRLADRHAGYHRRQAGQGVLPDVPRLTRLAFERATCLWVADDVDHLGVPATIREDPMAAGPVLTALLVRGGATPDSARERLCLGPGQPGLLEMGVKTGQVRHLPRQLSVAGRAQPRLMQKTASAEQSLTLLALSEDGVVEQITREDRLEAATDVAGIAGPWIWDRKGAVHHGLTMARAQPGRPDQPILAAALRGETLVVATPEALIEVRADGRGASLATLLHEPTAGRQGLLVATAWGVAWVRSGQLWGLPSGQGREQRIDDPASAGDLRAAALLTTDDPVQVVLLAEDGAVSLYRLDRPQPPLRWSGTGPPSSWFAEGGGKEPISVTLGYPDGSALRLLAVEAGLVEQPGIAGDGSAVTAILAGPGMTLLGCASGRLRWLADSSPVPGGAWGVGAVRALLRVDPATAAVLWADGTVGRIDLRVRQILPFPETDRELPPPLRGSRR